MAIHIFIISGYYLIFSLKVGLYFSTSCNPTKNSCLNLLPLIQQFCSQLLYLYFFLLPLSSNLPKFGCTRATELGKETAQQEK